MFKEGLPMRAICYAMMMTLSANAALLAQSSGRDARLDVDSVVLQRTRCLGTCPAYRIGVRGDGFVSFVSHNRSDFGRVESHTRGPEIMRRIQGQLDRAQFQTLPEITMGRAPYCRVAATDAPSISVSVFRATDVRSRSYYTGCLGESAQDTSAQLLIRRLRALGDSIDAIAAGKGWIRPASCCDI